jgi:hypothetical protein
LTECTLTSQDDIVEFFSHSNYVKHLGLPAAICSLEPSALSKKPVLFKESAVLFKESAVLFEEVAEPASTVIPLL